VAPDLEEMATLLRSACDTGVIHGTAPAHACPRNAYPWVVGATILASSMVFIDGGAVNLALPVLQTELHATNVQMQWVIEAYALFLSALILTGGSLGDRLGRKRMFLWGIAGFTVASVLCAVVQNPDELIAARALQGIASALLTPGSLSILGASFDEAQRGKAIGAWSAFTTLASMAGPVVGGVIIQHASWRWIFLVNVPLALCSMAISMRWVTESKDTERSKGVDLVGATLATVGLGCVVYALIAAGASGWTPPLLVLTAVGVALLVAFAVVEGHVKAPMMPLSLFRSRTFSAVNLQTLLLYAALGGVTFLLPFDFIWVQRYSPTVAGLAILPFIILVSLLSPLAGSLNAKIGARILLVCGAVLTAVSFVGLSLPGVGGSYWSTFFVPALILGLGMSMVVAPLTTTVMDAVSKDYFGVASGINNAVARAASLIAVATFGLVVAATFNTRLTTELERVAAPPAVIAAVNVQRQKLAAAQPPQNTPPALRERIRLAIDESYVAGFRRAMLLGAALSLASALCALALPRKKM
jgi:EmrB/QacA subfamily drug resistance transporter